MGYAGVSLCVWPPPGGRGPPPGPDRPPPAPPLPSAPPARPHRPEAPAPPPPTETAAPPHPSASPAPSAPRSPAAAPEPPPATHPPSPAPPSITPTIPQWYPLTRTRMYRPNSVSARYLRILSSRLSRKASIPAPAPITPPVSTVRILRRQRERPTYPSHRGTPPLIVSPCRSATTGITRAAWSAGRANPARQSRTPVGRISTARPRGKTSPSWDREVLSPFPAAFGDTPGVG